MQLEETDPVGASPSCNAPTKKISQFITSNNETFFPTA
jgi:hypothetical protein